MAVLSVGPDAVSADPSSSVARAVCAGIAVVAALAVANFNPLILPAALPDIQQYVVLAVWVCVIAASAMLPPLVPMGRGTDFTLHAAFYGFAMLSAAWSEPSPATILKAVALLVSTVAAYMVASRLTLDAFLDAIGTGLLVVCGVSLGVTLVWPSVGIDQSYFHRGQWQGVFESKQSLGIAGAFLIFLAWHRLVIRGGWWRFCVVFGIAAACVTGSGSRGGAVVAVAAGLSLSVPRAWILATRLLAFGPLACTALSAVVITFLVASGSRTIPLFGTEIDLTSRTEIWHYALSYFPDRPLLGFGLNGFWSIDTMIHGFEREHGWVLDNYHNGYIGILMETGLAGFLLFTASTLLCGLRLRWLMLQGGMRRSDTLAIIGFVNTLFVIDFTETFFLRSTNVLSMAMITLVFMSCRQPASVASLERRNDVRASRRLGIAA